MRVVWLCHEVREQVPTQSHAEAHTMTTQPNVGDEVTIATMSGGLVHGEIARTSTLYGRTTIHVSSHATGATHVTTPACIITNHTRKA